ncbi:MAG TPA: bifunctional acetate--CoA ligase family protein/GNAT family N-acetyltransferase [Anaeromyxobacteraceae bacterium]|nr:bifunctional acetate--CoA ligase family protein/GNAT family N-acetyltransferase [Anaeromyxobacteraceae bacterium]
MSTGHLHRLFRPRSVAVVGATNRPQRVGNVIMRNLLAGGFDGPIMPVNPRQQSVAGVLAYPDVASLPRTPDLAILCTPPQTIPDIVDELGARGTPAALVMARGLGALRDDRNRTLEERTLAAARRHRVRLLGGATLGILVPGIGLNASFSRVRALPGDLGFVSQSDALGTLVLDWAHPRRIGFSHFISLGDSTDVGFGEVLDYLGSDPDTRAILLYIEALRERRSFMAAARGAARNKPVIAIKAGRTPEAAAAPLSSDTLSLVEPDDVFDAALRRAGIVRVRDVEELFDAVETLAHATPLADERLAVVSNGGGAGVMVEDHLWAGGLRLPALSEATAARLRRLLPPGWDGRNPVDIAVDAPGALYGDVLEILLSSREFGAVLAVHTPTTLASSGDAARAVIRASRELGGNVLACWVGGDTAPAARALLLEAGVPSFDTPAAAARAFLFMVGHRRSRESLLQTPLSAPLEFRPDAAAARRVIRQALDEGRDYLRVTESMQVISAYGVRTAQVHLAGTPEEAGRVARSLGFPVELALRSPDVRRKWEVGGVVPSLETEEAVVASARGLVARLTEWRPDARVTGFSVQRMIESRQARRLFVGAALDPLFGPVILFGEGCDTEVVRDMAVALPPLNPTLARALVARTRVSALLQASPRRPAADADALVLALTQVAQIVVDHPEVVEVDINPLLADEAGVVAAGAFMRVLPASQSGADRLAIRPYPQDLEERAVLRDGREVLLRPIRPEDEAAHADFISRLSPEDSRFRFFHYVRVMPRSQLARLTQIDYEREMAFLAVQQSGSDAPEIIGVVRTVADPDNDTAELSIVVRSDLKRLGLGTRLLRKAVEYCRSRGTSAIAGDVLAGNESMLGLARRFQGFTISEPDREGIIHIRLRLR